MKKKEKISIVSLIEKEGKWWGGKRPWVATSGYLQLSVDPAADCWTWTTTTYRA